ELQDLGLELLLVDLLALELDRRLGDHVVGGEDGRLGADGERDRIGGARVDLDLLAVLENGDVRVEGVLTELGHRDPADRRAELLEHVAQEVVCHRPHRGLALKLHEDGGRLRMADPDGQELVPVGGLQQDDRLLADQIEADSVDEHLLHPRLDLASNIAQATRPKTPAYPVSGGWRWRHVHPLWLDDIESLEAISQNEDARRIFLRLAALSQTGRTPSFVVEVALDGELDAVTKGRLVELAQDESFLLAVEEYLVRTHRLH